MAGGTNVGEISLKLKTNKSEFERDLRSIEKCSKSTAGSMERSFSSSLSKIAKLAAAAFSIKKIADFGSECLAAGSKLNAMSSMADQAFGASSDQIKKWAKTTSTSVGLSERMALQYASTMGSMAHAFGFAGDEAMAMSTKLAELSGDVASYYAIGQDEAYTKLQSVFTGETESLKSLGIVMSQTALDQFAMANGFSKTTSQMTEQEKVMLRYQFILKQTELAEGDFARSSARQSWGNQMRVLKLQIEDFKAAIGQGLINILRPVIVLINTIMGKLVQLAQAFKAFTELITGKKSSGGISTGSTAASQMADDLGAASTGAEGLEDATKGVGTAAKKAAKEMKSLMGFDQINKLADNSEDASSDSGSGSGTGAGSGGGAGGGGFDFGTLAQGETVLDDVNKKFDPLIKKAKQLADIFKKGFKAGKGSASLEPIEKAIERVKKNLQEIFTASEVKSSANRYIETLAYSLGQGAGAIYSAGVTISTLLIGSIDKYLEQNKGRIKERFVKIFDIHTEITALAGDVMQALANIFSAFGGDNAQQALANYIGIYASAFGGAIELASKFILDIGTVLFKPLIDNQESLRQAIDNYFGIYATYLNTAKEFVEDTMDYMNKIYDEHLRPLFEDLAKGISEIVGAVVEAYNEHIAPVLKRLAENWDRVVKEHVQPMIHLALDLIGRLADLIDKLWVNYLQPFVLWVVQNIIPKLAPIIEDIGQRSQSTIGKICDFISGLLKALGGVITFLDGVFTNDWSLAWEGIKEIFGGIWESLAVVIRDPINSIIGMVNSLLSAVESMAWNVASAFNSLSIEIPDWSPIWPGATMGFNLPYISLPRVPYLAEGGFVKAHTPRLAMIGDNPTQGEIVAPEDKIRQLAGEALINNADVMADRIASKMQDVLAGAVMAMGVASQGPQEAVLVVDSVELARAVIKGNNKLDWRMHPTIQTT